MFAEFTKKETSTLCGEFQNLELLLEFGGFFEFCRIHRREMFDGIPTSLDIMLVGHVKMRNNKHTNKIQLGSTSLGDNPRLMKQTKNQMQQAKNHLDMFGNFKVPKNQTNK